MKTLTHFILAVLLLSGATSLDMFAQHPQQRQAVVKEKTSSASENAHSKKWLNSNFGSASESRLQHHAGPDNIQKKHLATIKHQSAKSYQDKNGQGSGMKSHHDTLKAIINNMKAHHEHHGSQPPSGGSIRNQQGLRVQVGH
ncbi:MAG: hypothetical protein OER04_07765 [Cyclobacteriaceae bacterium]|nr:hypothetical protein [Cyclobacteriaceae bacterium]